MIMTLIIVPLLMAALWWAAAKLKAKGLNFWELALFVVIGVVCIVAVTFGFLLWGFQDFG